MTMLSRAATSVPDEPAIPRARINPILGLIRGARKEPLSFFVRNGLDAEIVEFPNPIGRFFLVNEPAYIERILHNHRLYPKSDYYQRVRHLFGEGLFELEGEAWRRKRQTVQPAFHRERIDALVAMMTEEIGRMLDAWEPRARQAECFDVSVPLTHMTYNVITRALCNGDVRDELQEVSRSLTLILREGERVLWSLVPALHSIPGPRVWRLKRALDAFDLSIYRLVRDRMNAQSGPGDVLDLLLTQTDPETGAPIGFKELRDDLMTMLIAGHETTAMALTWSCILMSRNPHVRRCLKAEVANVLGGRVPTLKDLTHLQYTGWVIDEALRLYPPFWTISRKATQDDQFGSYVVPKGATLMLCPYVTHRNRRFWSNPEGFEPERFAPAASANRPKYAYFPFGGGPRVCLGKSFALMEAKLYLALLTQRYELDLVPGQELEPEPMISLRPRTEVRMALRPA